LHTEFNVDMGLFMNTNILRIGARFVILKIDDGGKYNTKESFVLSATPKGNGIIPRPEATVLKTNKVINLLDNLYPDMDYELTVEGKGDSFTTSFHTKNESVTLDVSDFGAVADGVHDDTMAIQTAINVCPKDGRVLIRSGKYAVTALFMKSDVSVEIAEGAELIGTKDASKLPILPGIVESYDEKSEYNFASWEGNPLRQYASMITGVCANNFSVYGRGVLNGNASFDDWWKIDKEHFYVARPNMFFTNNCENVLLAGVTVMDSPCWTLHPYFSKNIDIMDVTIKNPWNSPNTDGLDPESCDGMKAYGVHFSLGDDCIAIKSGKIYMGKKYKIPSSNMHIANCLMESGHGAVTVGSEIAGGVNNIKVEDCVFHDTDRGLRIKTRRGRGKDSVLDKIVFENIEMDHVLTPFVVNSFYFCDPDGKTDYVQSRSAYPVDDRTPSIGQLVFRNIEAKDTEYAAGYYLGLPESPIKEIVMENVNVTYKFEAGAGQPAMSNGVPDTSKAGIYAENVESLVMNNVNISGQDGDAVVRVGIGSDKN